MRRFLSIVLALGLVLSFSLVTAVPVMAFTEVWVDASNPSCPGTGTQSDPFCTIQDGIDYIFVTLMDDGIVHVAAGTYNENIDLENGVDVLGAGANVTIIDVTVSGGIAVNIDSVGPTTTIDGFTITGGSDNFGSGIYNNDSSPTVSNCIITGNQAANFGGGMYNLNNSSPVVVNCIFTGNSAGVGGGGICCWGNGSSTITNCTIVGNSAVAFGGGIYVDGSISVPTITNNIIASNTAALGSGVFCNSVMLSIDYNDVYFNDLFNCTSNHDPAADPVFVGGGDYHLQASSNCIDVGNNGAPYLPATDFDGEPRIYPAGGTVDMGADEYYVAPPPPPSSTVGGTVHPIDKAALLLPWLGLGLALVLAAGGLILIRRRS